MALGTTCLVLIKMNLHIIRCEANKDSMRLKYSENVMGTMEMKIPMEVDKYIMLSLSCLLPMIL